MRVLLDTNVLLDYLIKREPYYENSRKIMDVCSSDKVTVCMAAHSVMNIFYILMNSNIPAILPEDFLQRAGY